RSSAIRIEEEIGVITCVIERTDKRTGMARFGLPHLPAEVGVAPDRLRIAGALGIEPEDIGTSLYSPAVWSAGVAFYLVPVKSAKVLAKVRAERRGWNEVFPLGHNCV